MIFCRPYNFGCPLNIQQVDAIQLAKSEERQSRSADGADKKLPISWFNSWQKFALCFGTAGLPTFASPCKFIPAPVRSATTGRRAASYDSKYRISIKPFGFGTDLSTFCLSGLRPPRWVRKLTVSRVLLFTLSTLCWRVVWLSPEVYGVGSSVHVVYASRCMGVLNESVTILRESNKNWFTVSYRLSFNDSLNQDYSIYDYFHAYTVCPKIPKPYY